MSDKQSPHRIVFANEKGGTGKSTTAVHVAIALAYQGARVAAIDLEGIEAADTIVSAKRDYNDKPLADQRMKTVTVETFGVEYPEPERM